MESTGHINGLTVTAPAGAVISGQLPADTRPAFTISNQQITADGQPVTFFAGNYYCEPGQVIQMVGNITDENSQTVESITIPVALKMPLIRHANGRPTQDEIYLNVTLQNGVLTATGTIPWSGDWKIIIERNNEAIQRIGANWKLQHEDITFLA
ncbi:MAG TPA: hypothetical protein DF774_10430 [Rheinheimera sp.]|uniref:hypothetical protein n=1 Tax=Rheinheimera sp. TaxID=1869214 RepID=UPI000EE0F04B|nr:hypothetical protein [Rheinheimera sp.]HCU66163.1 hypothetical protein [Rheinheimera sp.]